MALYLLHSLSLMTKHNFPFISSNDPCLIIVYTDELCFLWNHLNHVHGVLCYYWTNLTKPNAMAPRKVSVLFIFCERTHQIPTFWRYSLRHHISKLQYNVSDTRLYHNTLVWIQFISSHFHSIFSDKNRGSAPATFHTGFYIHHIFCILFEIESNLCCVIPLTNNTSSYLFSLE